MSRATASACRKDVAGSGIRPPQEEKPTQEAAQAAAVAENLLRGFWSPYGRCRGSRTGKKAAASMPSPDSRSASASDLPPGHREALDRDRAPLPGGGAHHRPLAVRLEVGQLGPLVSSSGSCPQATNQVGAGQESAQPLERPAARTVNSDLRLVLLLVSSRAGFPAGAILGDHLALRRTRAASRKIPPDG